MFDRHLLARLAVVLSFLTAIGQAQESPWFGREATRSRITIVDLDGSDPKVVLDSPHRYAAPEWTPDGKELIVNGGGKLWRVPVAGGTPRAIATGPITGIDVNHAISPDGKTLAFTAGALWKVPIDGGRPVRVREEMSDWVHGWSPDGRKLAFSADRGHGMDIFTISADGRGERRLTTSPRVDDVPHFSPDGRWIYFLSDRGGPRDVWRIPADGAGPGTRAPSRLPTTAARTPRRTLRPTASGWSTYHIRLARGPTPPTGMS